ncbi:MAG: type II/IV secretion system protein [Ramlibacter sp.]|nr:type II/IV secretion system protein [Ramlibacter sp.]
MHLTANESIWRHLSGALNLGPQELADLLSEQQGVVVLQGGQWTRSITSARPLGTGPSQPGYELKLDAQTFLLVDDPWSESALRILSQRHDGSTALALALPGQMQELARITGGEGAPRTSISNSQIPEAQGSVVVDFVNRAIGHAYAEGASDVHFETNRQGIGVKYRLDGVMVAGDRLNEARLAEEVVSRIKVLAQLDITERRRPQDGRTRWQHASGNEIDLRVSVMPSIFGEDVVLRLLDKARLPETEKAMTLDLLGFDLTLGQRIRSLASKPHGMLLVTGPTGSGKTTTVYAALSEVNNGLEKIITIEDPVEYELAGVLQIPVNEQKGLTFATGLRSILRHDPDKILVGEIRDAETAEIAVQSSLTGHLVFTTVHANSLFDVIGRFQHFDIDPFGLASALNGVVVQRLLRKLCSHCMSWRACTSRELSLYESVRLPSPDRLPVPNSCDHCRGTGYRGRIVVAEVHELSDAVRDLMVRKATMTELKSGVYREDSDNLLARALDMVKSGVTSIEEVSRVVGLA